MSTNELELVEEYDKALDIASDYSVSMICSSPKDKAVSIKVFKEILQWVEILEKSLEDSCRSLKH